MKTIRLIFTFFTIPICLIGQNSIPPDSANPDFIKSLDGIEWVVIESKETIVLNAQEGRNLTISGYNEIEDDIKQVENTNDNNKGYFIFKEGNNLIVRDLRNRYTSTTISLPKDQNIKIRSLGQQNIYASNFTGEIDASTIEIGKIIITECSGTLVLSTNTGNINVSYENIKFISPISASSTSGNISLLLQKNTYANVDLESSTTKIYSDFRIKGRSIKSVGERVKGTINEGGPKIQLTSILGKISLNKN